MQQPFDLDRSFGRGMQSRLTIEKRGTSQSAYSTSRTFTHHKNREDHSSRRMASPGCLSEQRKTFSVRHATVGLLVSIPCQPVDCRRPVSICSYLQHPFTPAELVARCRSLRAFQHRELRTTGRCSPVPNFRFGLISRNSAPEFVTAGDFDH
jgi:hypothetical protein